jgi:hypothetical protein
LAGSNSWTEIDNWMLTAGLAADGGEPSLDSAAASHGARTSKPTIAATGVGSDGLRILSAPEVSGFQASGKALAQCRLLFDQSGGVLLAERRKPPGSPTVIPDGSRRAATK